MMARKLVVTSALPNANGPIHIGHLVEYLQTDIWVRFQKVMGHECRYFCADDTHGTPVMIRAKSEGITPEALIRRVQEEHTRDFADFEIEFDNYYSTHSDENRIFSEMIYNRANARGSIVKKEIEAGRMMSGKKCGFPTVISRGRVRDARRRTNTAIRAMPAGRITRPQS